MKDVRGSGGGKAAGGEQRTPIEAPDSLHSIAYAKILDLVSEGEIYGFADRDHPMRCIYLSEVPVENADGTQNFTNFQIDSRVGTQDQDYINGFEGVENEIAVGFELRTEAAYTQVISNIAVTAIRVRIAVLALTKADPTNGDINGNSVGYKIELQTGVGAFVTKLENSFTGKTTTKYERSHRIDLPPSADGWTVRVSRTTPNTTSSTEQGTTAVESITEIVDAKLRMPMSALVSTIVDAKQFPSIPSRAFHMKGRLIKVPSNYDPETRLYDGIWDGTFQIAYSNNPAWVYYDMAINDRYGLGHILPIEQINKWKLYSIGVYCDEFIDDGLGGVEPRFTANVYYQVRQDAYRFMQDMATMFRGISYVASGNITAVADMPEDPTLLYTNANVKNGKFKYSGSSKKVRHTVALVSWNDMSNFGRTRVEYIEDPEGIAKYGIQETQVIALGCTSRGQARRQGKYILISERLETEVASFDVGMDGALAAPGKIIKIADRLRAGKRMGGRVSNPISTTEFYADSTVIGAPGDTVSVMMADGTLSSATVDSITTNHVVLSTALSGLPEKNAIWLIESSELYAQTFRVLAVTESSEGPGYEVAALKHNPYKFDLIEDGTPIPDLPISNRPVLARPTGLTVVNNIRYGHGVAANVLFADWENVPGATGYGVQWQKDNGNWSQIYHRDSSNDEWDNAFTGTYRVRVWATNSQGLTGPSVVSDAMFISDAVFPTIDLALNDSGLLVIDCRFTQFRLLLVENIDPAQVVFINVAPQDEISIEITNTGSFTFGFPSSCVPVDGVPYVVSDGAGRTDVVRLTTNNTGVQWFYNFTLSSPFSITITPDPASASSDTDGATPSHPSITLTANATGYTSFVDFVWERVGTSGTSFDDAGLTSSTLDLSIPDGVSAYNVTQTWKVTGVDGDGLLASATRDVTLQRFITGSDLTANDVYAVDHTTAYAPITVSGSSTAVASFGTGPWTYAWTLVSGTLAHTATGLSTATATFSRTGTRFAPEYIYNVVATDSLGATRNLDVNIILEIIRDGEFPGEEP